MNLIVASATLHKGEFDWSGDKCPEFLALEIRWGCEGEVTLIVRHSETPDYKDGYDFSYHASIDKCLWSIEYYYGRRMRRKIQDSLEYSVEYISDAFARLRKFKTLHCDTENESDDV